MGLSILNHFLPIGLLVELNVQLPFLTFPRVTSVTDMVASRLVLHPLLTQSLLDMFFRCQVFHQKTLQISIIILAIHYVVSLLNVDTYFP